MTKPRPLAVIRNRRLNSVALLVPLRSVQFSSVAGRHQEQAPKQRCTFSPTAFSSVQFSARTSMVDSVSCLRHAECSRAPDHVTDGCGHPKQTTSCTWPHVVPVGEDPAAHGHQDSAQAMVVLSPQNTGLPPPGHLHVLIWIPTAASKTPLSSVQCRDPSSSPAAAVAGLERALN